MPFPQSPSIPAANAPAPRLSYKTAPNTHPFFTRAPQLHGFGPGGPSSKEQSLHPRAGPGAPQERASGAPSRLNEHMDKLGEVGAAGAGHRAVAGVLARSQEVCVPAWPVRPSVAESSPPELCELRFLT